MTGSWDGPGSTGAWLRVVGTIALAALAAALIVALGQEPTPP